MNEKQNIVGEFEIPDDFAEELSDLLVKQSIRERALDRMLKDGDFTAYEELEKMLMPISEKIEAMKLIVTREYVPDKYRSSKYSWNYSGYAFSKNVVEVLEN